MEARPYSLFRDFGGKNFFAQGEGMLLMPQETPKLTGMLTICLDSDKKNSISFTASCSITWSWSELRLEAKSTGPSTPTTRCSNYGQ